MNANELADKLDEYCGSLYFGNIKISEATTMLRQLQAENEAVKESNKNLMELVTMLREEVNKLRKAQEK